MRGPSTRGYDPQVKKVVLYPVLLVSAWEAVNIAHENAGDLPPKGNVSWRAYWHRRFIIMQGVEDSGRFSHIGRDNIAFIKRERAEAGLPPVD